ncbi:isopenicillin N synthase family dioxygenase [Novosphingobium mangrovi (ex Huang et al. 2023)]|uniref:2-oxoglutarate-dependent ethylene/succinate-forming enzyme n=1 Tax=Novosphingobium mangrovi (ex Huang et al. 2023) TaxID=2976432 RepID=A0ABT2I1W6_9SPHN|nr:2-oxoglutarate and iron-dependent oxygenase domain-containing protein [Novosphingobium mangrovi (ex Huang et al. 2023)]MCT2398799.1 isopenicillin N synthase family oxygenase [Novosphingobium mangrovi (ex Huang et al. 2023)]
MDNLPIIDLAPMLNDEPGGLERVATEIGEAARTIGFFYVRNHGVDEGLIDALYALAVEFFALPLEEKEKLSIAKVGNNRGYAGVGTESLDPEKLTDAKEAFNVGRDPEAGEEDDDSQVSRGRNQWPDVPGFRDVASEYYAAVRRLSEQLHRAFALDLGVPPDYFAPYVDRPMATLRMLHYPPHPGRFDGTRYGAGAHTDYGNLTLLSQCEVGGLEVRTRAGDWISAPPVPGTFVCNIGDCLMRWSNDTYVSNPHRVVNRSGTERYSIAFFFDPNPDALVECLPSCISEDRPALYPPITAGDHLLERLDATYAHRKSAG